MITDKIMIVFTTDCMYEYMNITLCTVSVHVSDTVSENISLEYLHKGTLILWDHSVSKR